MCFEASLPCKILILTFLLFVFFFDIRVTLIVSVLFSGSHASWKVLEFILENSRTWKVLEIKA